MLNFPNPLSNKPSAEDLDNDKKDSTESVASDFVRLEWGNFIIASFVTLYKAIEANRYSFA